MYLKKCHISWPSNCFVEGAKFIEANNTFFFTFFRIYYLHIKTIQLGTLLRILESKFTDFIHEISSWGDGILAVQKKMESHFYFYTTRAQWIKSILKVMSKFMSSKMTQIYTQSCEQFYPIYFGNTNTLFGIILLNLSKDFLNILCYSQLCISKLNLFHSLIGQGKKELAKYSDMQKICLMLLLFRVRQAQSSGKIQLQR